MRARPIDPRTLIHTVRWIPKRLATKEDIEKEAHVIEHVRLSPMVYFFPIGEQQTNIANWKLFWCPVKSTKIDDKFPAFAIGDTIEFLSAPVYPKVTTILTITPQWDLDGKSVHHYEISLR